MGVFRDAGQCICRGLAGSIRVILFIGCALVVVVELAGLIGTIRGAELLRDVEQRSAYLSYGYSLLSMGIGLLGCYGAYKDHAPSIRVFTFALGLSIVFLVGTMAMYNNPESLKAYNEKLIKPLEANRPNYDWSHKDTSEKKLAITRKWDNLQAGAMCCGVKGHAEWDMFRPADISASLFPSSCCLSPAPSQAAAALCKEQDVFLVGCHSRLEQLEAALILGAVLYVVFLALLLVVGLFALCKCCFPRDVEQSSGFCLQIAS